MGELSLSEILVAERQHSVLLNELLRNARYRSSTLEPPGDYDDEYGPCSLIQHDSCLLTLIRLGF